MNEAINKHGLPPKNSRPESHASSVLAPPQVMTETQGDTRRERPEIKSIPFTGLLTNKLLARLPGEEFARLLPYMEPVSLAADEYIYGLGDNVDFIYFPETVVISQIHLLEDGNTTEVALIGKEGVVGLSAIFGAPVPNYWSQVIIAGSALRVRVEALNEGFHRGQSLQKLLLAYTGKRIAQISQRAVCNGRHTLLGRMATWLLMLHDRAGDGELRLTHEEIARHLGARRASISVTATILRDKAIISYNRGNILLLDRQALMANACECYRTLARYSA